MHIINITIYNIYVNKATHFFESGAFKKILHEKPPNPQHLPPRKTCPTLASRSNFKDSNQRPPFSQALAAALDASQTSSIMG